jgi:hypothetical protein
MTAYDFLLCCVGFSCVLVSAAWAARLLTNGRPKAAPVVAPQPAPETLDAGLAGRLREFQQGAQFAPSIVRRPTAGEPGGPRTLPSRVTSVKGRTFSSPKQPTRKSTPPPLPKDVRNDNVVVLPLKDKKPDTEPKT